jgi:hypothetical protein
MASTVVCDMRLVMAVILWLNGAPRQTISPPSSADPCVHAGRPAALARWNLSHITCPICVKPGGGTTGSGRAGKPAIALRQKSARRLEDSLLASALAQLVRQPDPRDLLVGMAVHYIVAEQIGAVPSAVFDDIARRLPDGPLPDLSRQFGARQDVTLEAFGWQLVQTPQGPDFIPA